MLLGGLFKNKRPLQQYPKPFVGKRLGRFNPMLVPNKPVNRRFGKSNPMIARFIRQRGQTQVQPQPQNNEGNLQLTYQPIDYNKEQTQPSNNQDTDVFKSMLLAGPIGYHLGLFSNLPVFKTLFSTMFNNSTLGE